MFPLKLAKFHEMTRWIRENSIFSAHLINIPMQNYHQTFARRMIIMHHYGGCLRLEISKITAQVDKLNCSNAWWSAMQNYTMNVLNAHGTACFHHCIMVADVYLAGLITCNLCGFSSVFHCYPLESDNTKSPQQRSSCMLFFLLRYKRDQAVEPRRVQECTWPAL